MTQSDTGRIAMHVSIAKVQKNLAEALNRVACRGERVILERRGEPVAAIISMDDLKLLEQIEDQTDVKAARKARKEKAKPVRMANVKARLGMK